MGQGDGGELAFGLGSFIKRVKVGLGESGGRNGENGEHRNRCGKRLLDGHPSLPDWLFAKACFVGALANWRDEVERRYDSAMTMCGRPCDSR
jgi:hypothetical protein